MGRAGRAGGRYQGGEDGEWSGVEGAGPGDAVRAPSPCHPRVPSGYLSTSHSGARGGEHAAAGGGGEPDGLEGGEPLAGLLGPGRRREGGLEYEGLVQG